MTEKFVSVRQVVGGAEVRKGRTVATPPAAPGTLTATPGDTQVALSWVASATPSVTYQVRRVNANTVVASPSGTSTTVTGLTNSVTYNFQVYAVDAAGRISAPSNIATAVPTPAGVTPVATYFGYNTANNTAKGDGPNQLLSGRQAWFDGRAPMVRIYGTAGLNGGSFSPTTTTAPEKRCCFSYKSKDVQGTADFTLAQLANGTATATMIQWLQDIPAGWVVVWVFHHEPNSSGGMEIDPTLYKQVYHQMRLALNAATLATGTKVFLAANFMAFQLTGSSWSDSWVPSLADIDWLTWDDYGNPGVNTSPTGSNVYGGPATGQAYGTTYPLPSARYADMFAITARLGFADRWGVLEQSSPGRDWDPTEAGRAAWQQDTIDLHMSPPMAGSTPPRIFLLWEAHSGVKWDQAFGRQSGNATPLVNVWKPYITGVPLTG